MVRTFFAAHTSRQFFSALALSGVDAGASVLSAEGSCAYPVSLGNVGHENTDRDSPF
jgi:hypothetical protein